MSTPPPPPPPPARPGGTGRYGWLIGVLVVIIMTYIAINTLRTNGPGAQGPRPGHKLSPFAAPLILSSLEGDANVATKPHSGDAGAVPACSVHRPDALNACDLMARGPVVMGFFFTRGSSCAASFDVMQRLTATQPGVQFAGVVVRGDRDEARKIVRQHHWTFPIAYDHDGQVANLYGIAGCPEVVLAYPGGIVRKTVVGRDRAERALPRYVAALVAASRDRGWSPPGMSGELVPGWIDPEVAEEFPDLDLVQLTVPAGSGPSAPEVRERLRYLSRRMSGAEAVAFRTRPIPQAYRVLFRHLGLDPDETRPPAEAVVVERLIKGEYAHDNRLDDAITVAVAETGVPVWALDEDKLTGSLGLRPAQAGETLGTAQYANELPAGRLVLADEAGAVGILFGKLATSHLVTGETTTTRLFSVRAPNVPPIHIEEALWTCVECLRVEG